MNWSEIKFFTKAGRHFIFPDLTESSRFELVSNNGQTIVLFADKRTVIASDYGSEKQLIQYDLRPAPAYTSKEGSFSAHPRGKFKIVGYYPNYFLESSGERVYLGPRMNFYFEPQRPVDQLANDGLLLVDQRRAKLCLNCENLIPVTAGPNAKYCCYECGLRTASDKFEYSRQRADYRAFRKKMAEILQKPERLCLTCEGPIDNKKVGPNAKYCCYECGLRTAEDIARGDYKWCRPGKPCATCEAPIPKGTGSGAKYCCYECGLRTAEDKEKYRSERLALKTQKLKRLIKSLRGCKKCGGPIDFVKHGGRAKYCSVTCGLRPARVPE